MKFNELLQHYECGDTFRITMKDKVEYIVNNKQYSKKELLKMLNKVESFVVIWKA